MTSGAAIVLGPATVNLSTNSLDCLAKYLRVGQFNKWAMTNSVPCPSGNLQAIVVQKNCNLLRGKRLGDWHSCLRSRGSEWLRNESGSIRAAPAVTSKVRCDVTSGALRKAGEEEKVARSKAGSRQ